MVKVMVVDDSALMRGIIRNYINSCRKDCKFIEANSGKESIELYKKDRPNLVFMDILMPEMDGLKTTELIRKLDPSAKIIICTSVGNKDTIKKAERAGCLAYITKPFKLDDISKALKFADSTKKPAAS